MSDNNPWAKEIENLTRPKKNSNSNNSSSKKPTGFKSINVNESFNPITSKYSIDKKNK
jgi:hypothetical protein